MSARDEILQAIEQIERRSGQDTFTMLNVLAEMRRTGTRYAESTIRTHICSHMCVDAPGEALYPDLERLGLGLYRRLRDGEPAASPPKPQADQSGPIAEDEVKRAVAAHLEAQGFSVQVAWGGARGIDIEARRGAERLVLEAKGKVANPPQQVNYFLNALGELVQRMDDPHTRYGLALPDNRQYRRLVGRLPAHARERLGLVVFFVRREGNRFAVEVEGLGGEA
jgi:hypothetical protein